MIIECYQDSSTRSVLEFVHFVLFKVVISNLYAQLKMRQGSLQKKIIIWDSEMCNWLQTATEGSHDTEC